METSRVRVTIFGQTYTINGDAPGEYIQQLASYLNEKMEEVQANCAAANSAQVAILAALNVADEYFQLKKLKSGEENEVERRATALISMLDQGLVGDVFARSAPAARN